MGNNHLNFPIFILEGQSCRSTLKKTTEVAAVGGSEGREGKAVPFKKMIFYTEAVGGPGVATVLRTNPGPCYLSTYTPTFPSASLELSRLCYLYYAS